jgi:hypothetical protein
MILNLLPVEEKEAEVEMEVEEEEEEEEQTRAGFAAIPVNKTWLQV